MKKLVMSVLASGAMTSFALAEPVQMTNVQLDETVAAGKPHKAKHGKGHAYGHRLQVRDVNTINNDNDATATVNISAEKGGKVFISYSTITATASATTTSTINGGR